MDSGNRHRDLNLLQETYVPSTVSNVWYRAKELGGEASSISSNLLVEEDLCERRVRVSIPEI